MRSRMSGIIVLFISSVIVGVTMVYADLINLRCGEGRVTGTTTCQVTINDRAGNEVFWTSIMCQECHKAPLKSGQDLQKGFDGKSQIKHSNEYIFAFLPTDVEASSRFIVPEGKRYEWGKGIFIIREKGRLTVINETEKYRLLFDSDAVIVKDRFSKPCLITTAHKIQKVSLLDRKDPQL